MGARSAVFAVIAGVAPVVAATGAARPNLLLIVSDDQGYADVGVHGCTDYATPHLDSIARNGVRFSSGYVSAPQCAEKATPRKAGSACRSSCSGRAGGALAAPRYGDGISIGLH